MSSLLTELRIGLARIGLCDPNTVKDLMISIFHPRVSRKESAQSRIFLVYDDKMPIAFARWYSGNWPFAIREIVETQKLYGHFSLVRAPRILGTFTGGDGNWIIEEVLNQPVSMEQMMADGKLSLDRANELLRTLANDIWDNGEQTDINVVHDELKSLFQSIHDVFQDDPIASVLVDAIKYRLSLLKNVEVRRVYSQGDLIPGNFIFSADHWYLVDFEYSSRTSLFCLHLRRDQVVNQMPLFARVNFDFPFEQMGNHLLMPLAIALAYRQDRLVLPEEIDTEVKHMRRNLCMERLDSVYSQNIQRISILEEQLCLTENSHKRVLNHPVTGRVISLLQFLKRDPSFGSLK